MTAHENHWGDLNPGTNYKTLLKKAQRMHPKEYPVHHAGLNPKKLNEAKSKKPKIVLLPEEEDEGIF